MKQHYNKIEDNKNIYYEAITDCFHNKWTRNDVLTYIEKNTGTPRHEIFFSELEEASPVRYYVASSCELALSEMIDEILNGEDPEIEMPKIRKRRDGLTGKIRDIALLSIEHQLLEHVVYLLLRPLFQTTIYPTQHASIPRRGQNGLVKQLSRYLRRKLGIKYFVKTDMKGAYASVKYTKVIELLKRDIPSAKEIFALMEFLTKLAPDGHLIIGGYLDAWLFNYVMSKVLKNAYTFGRTRRGKFIRDAIRIVSFMDDCVVLTSSIKGAKNVIRNMVKFSKEKLDMTLKVTTGIIKLLDVDKEKRKRESSSKANRGCPCIDMAGYKVYRGHVAIRRRVLLRLRRQFLRAYIELKRTGTIQIQRARKIISYNGFVKGSNSNRFSNKYHVKAILKIAKTISSFHSVIELAIRRDVINDLRECTEQYKTKLDCGGGTSRWPAESSYFKKRLGCSGRRTKLLSV